jgi:hypothetical protein
MVRSRNTPLKRFLRMVCLGSGFLSMLSLVAGFGLYVVTRDGSVVLCALAVGVAMALVFLATGAALED